MLMQSFMVEDVASHALHAWPWKLQINLMSMTLYKCWSICSPTLTEPPWTMAELRHAISRLKSKKNGDDLGLVAELLKHSPDDSLNALLLVMKEVFPSGNVPSSWQRAFFNMLPETKAAKSVSELRPMANVRLFVQTLCIPHVWTHGRRN